MRTKEIDAALCEVKVIDTHEHLWDESWRLAHPGEWTDLFYHYGITALRGAGMTEAEGKILYDPASPQEAKWPIFSRYFPLAKNTAYLQSVLIAIRNIYGINEITADSVRDLSARMRGRIRPGFHRQILRDLAGIDYCLVNCFDTDENQQRYPARFEGDLDLMRPDLFGDSFLWPANYSLLQKLTGVDATTFDGFLQAADSYFARFASRCGSLKIAAAYGGRLNFDPTVSRVQAERQFYDHLKSPQPYAKTRPLMDYLFYHVLHLAREYHLPLKFHAGIYSGANSLDMDAMRENVKDLATLAIAHPDQKFIAMHIAYPYQDELVLAIKQVTNLYADMSWIWVVDPMAAADFLKKALVAAPVVKITGFGGDYSLVENAYGHLVLARHGIAGALGDLVDAGYFTLGDACHAGEFLLRRSAELLYAR